MVKIFRAVAGVFFCAAAFALAVGVYAGCDTASDTPSPDDSNKPPAKPDVAMSESTRAVKVDFSSGSSSVRWVSLSGLQNNNVYVVKVNNNAAAAAGKTGSASVSSAVSGSDSGSERAVASPAIPYTPALDGPVDRWEKQGARDPAPDSGLAEKLRSASTGRAASPPDYTVGTSTRRFKIYDADPVDSTLRAQGVHSNIWVANANFAASSGTADDNRLTASQAETLAAKFDDIYDAETNLFGYEYGGAADAKVPGGVDGDPRIQILVFDIGGDYKKNQNSGVLGYFYTGDAFSNNFSEMFYLDAHFIDAYPSWMYSTLVHEFQHMINYNVFTIEQKLSPASWYNEMLSMLAEDVIDPMIGIPLSDDGHPCLARIPRFLLEYSGASVASESWAGNVSDYSMSYAFGAYLARNFGGAALIKDLMTSDAVNIQAINAALGKDGRNSSYADALGRFAEVLFFSGSKGGTDTMRSFDKTAVAAVGDITYTFPGFDIWFIQYASGENTYTGPRFQGVKVSNAMDPNSISAHTAGEWSGKSGNLMVKLTKPAAASVDFYVIKQ